jgi:hypothetical protein
MIESGRDCEDVRAAADESVTIEALDLRVIAEIAGWPGKPGEQCARA